MGKGRKRPQFLAFLRRAVAAEGIQAGAQSLLDPLARYDRDHGGDLIQTLQVYFAHGGNASRASEALFLHRNGLLYRLGRVEEILGISLQDQEVSLALKVALRARAGEAAG